MGIDVTPKQLKKLRKKLGYSLATASSLVHVTPRTWARYESGDSPISETVIHLFAVLNGLEYPIK